MGLGVYNGSWEPQWVPGLSRGPKTQWVWDHKELQGHNGAQAPNGPGDHHGGQGATKEPRDHKWAWGPQRGLNSP